jgi:hypothetical protein
MTNTLAIVGFFAGLVLSACRLSWCTFQSTKLILFTQLPAAGWPKKKSNEDIARKKKEKSLFPVTIETHDLRHTSSYNFISDSTQFCSMVLDCVFESQDFLPTPFFVYK